VDNEELDTVGRDGGMVGVDVVDGDGRLTGRDGGAEDGERESRFIVGVGVVDLGVQNKV
jgi:hypothetical protein